MCIRVLQTISRRQPNATRNMSASCKQFRSTAEHDTKHARVHCDCAHHRVCSSKRLREPYAQGWVAGKEGDYFTSGASPRRSMCRYNSNTAIGNLSMPAYALGLVGEFSEMVCSHRHTHARRQQGPIRSVACAPASEMSHLPNCPHACVWAFSHSSSSLDSESDPSRSSPALAPARMRLRLRLRLLLLLSRTPKVHPAKVLHSSTSKSSMS